LKTIKVNDGTFTTEDFQLSREIELIGEVAHALRDANQDLPPPHRAPDGRGGYETPWGGSGSSERRGARREVDGAEGAQGDGK
jgi:hypothetical protein